MELYILRVMSRGGWIGYSKCVRELDRVSDADRGQDLYRERTIEEQSWRTRQTWTKTDAHCDGAGEDNRPHNHCVHR